MTSGTTMLLRLPFCSTFMITAARSPQSQALPRNGNVFILDRTTGRPIFGVEERRVPQSDVVGEQSSPTQPFPLAPRPLAPQSLSLDSVFGATPADRQWCHDEIAKLRNDGVYTPPS